MKTLSLILHRLTFRQIGIVALVAAVAALAVAGGLTRHHSVAGTVPPVVLSPGWSSTTSGGGAVATPDATLDATAPSVATSPSASGDDGAADPAPSSSGAGGGDLSAAQEVTVEFLARYLNTQGQSVGQWRNSWRQMVTDQEAQLLADADPTRVPVGRVGPVNGVTPLGAGQVEVTVAVVANSDPNKTVTILKVTAVLDHLGFWLVSQLDEVRAS